MVALRNADSRTLLRVYLNDHLAAVAGVLALARRTRSQNSGPPLAGDLDVLISELSDDRDTLAGLLRELGLAEDRVKQMAANAAEIVGRLKLNGQVLGYSALSRLVELEGLRLGVDANARLWHSLQAVADRHPAIAHLDLNGLVQRTERQAAMLEQHLQSAAQEAFA